MIKKGDLVKIKSKNRFTFVANYKDNIAIVTQVRIDNSKYYFPRSYYLKLFNNNNGNEFGPFFEFEIAKLECNEQKKNNE